MGAPKETRGERGRNSDRSRFLRWAMVALGVVGSVAAIWLVYEWREGVRQKRGPEPTPAHTPSPEAVAVYAYGDSTMVGEPYFQALNIPKIVSWCFDGRIGERPLEIQNFATTGNSLIGNPPEPIYEVLDDLERFRPAAILLHIGHMEYFNTGHLLQGGPSDVDPVAVRFGQELREFAERVHEAGVPLLVAIPVANRAAWPPGDYQPPDEAAGRVFEEAQRRFDAGDAAGALVRLDGALSRWPQFVSAHFLRGLALRALGRDERARRAFTRAVDQDRRSRATSPMCEEIRKLCREGLAVCVDPEPALIERYGFLDERVFADVHHPLANGYAVIGQAFADALASVLDVPAPRRVDPEHLPPDLDPSDVAFTVLLRRATWMIEESLGSRGLARRWALRRSGELFDEAEGIAATRAERKELAARRAALAAVQGKKDEALRLLEEAREAPTEPSVTGLLRNSHVRALLESHGVAP